MTAAAEKHLTEANNYFDKVTADLAKIMAELGAIGEINGRPQTYYDTVEEALKHQNTIHTLETLLC